MKDDKPPAAGAALPDTEPFLERWSRRKAQAREGIDDEPADAAVEAVPGAPQGGPPEEARPVPQLPDLDSLDADSDYSAFMGASVDESLRRDALRKLFRSPKFNVLDGLDDYCDDFTQWKALGDVVTADMRHHLERAAKLAQRELEKCGDTGPAAPAPAPAVASAAADGDETPESDDSTEHHERPERPA